MKTSVKKNILNWLLVFIFNVTLVEFALYVVDLEMTEKNYCEEVTEIPFEVSLPSMTLTDEMMIDMFFQGLRVDPSLIEPKKIEKSLGPWDTYVKHYSSQYGVDPDLIRAIIYAESKGDPYSISKNGALGLMQIMPSTANYMDINNLLDPEENIKFGVKYIASLTRKFGDPHVLWAWNAGPNKLKQNKMPVETKRFIVEVYSVRKFLKDDKNNTI